MSIVNLLVCLSILSHFNTLPVALSTLVPTKVITLWSSSVCMDPAWSGDWALLCKGGWINTKILILCFHFKDHFEDTIYQLHCYTHLYFKNKTVYVNNILLLSTHLVHPICFFTADVVLCTLLHVKHAQCTTMRTLSGYILCAAMAEHKRGKIRKKNLEQQQKRKGGEK